MLFKFELFKLTVTFETGLIVFKLFILSSIGIPNELSILKFNLGFVKPNTPVEALLNIFNSIVSFNALTDC